MRRSTTLVRSMSMARRLAAGTIAALIYAQQTLAAGPSTVTFPNSLSYGVTLGSGGEYHSTTALVDISNPANGATISGGSLQVTVQNSPSFTCVSGCNGSNGSVGNTAAAVPPQATYLGANLSGNLTGLTLTANGLKVDGSAATQPVSGTVTLGTGAATIGALSLHQSTNVDQIGGAALALGQTTMAASLPVTMASNQGNISTNVAQIAGTAPTVKASGTNAATTDTALVIAPSPNPSTVCSSVKAVNQTASTDLVTSVAKLHICSIVLVSATAQNLSLVEGTGTTCATGIAALIGGTTASVAVAANGGFATASERAWLVTQTTADHLCLLQSGTGNVSGVITYLDHN